MAKASVTITCNECGNTFTWSKNCKNRDEADRAVEWAKEGGIIYCPNCMYKFKTERRKKEDEEKKQAILERISELEPELELSTLEGSEKQIAWAESIRIKSIKTLLGIIDSWAKNVCINNTDEQYVETFKSAMGFVNSIKSAKEWIEKRDDYERIDFIMDNWKKFTEKNEVQ